MRKKKYFLLSILFSIFIVASSFAGEDWSISKVQNYYSNLSKSEKIEFHKNLVKLLAKQTKATRFQNKKYKETFSYVSPIESLLSFVDKAYADGSEREEILCNFGGWMSRQEDNTCIPPWKRAIREDPRLSAFGDTYTSDYSCGGANLFRCNPLIFGGGSDGKGICAQANDSDPRDSTLACIIHFDTIPDSYSDLIDELSEDPERLTQYVGVVAETMRFCDVNFDLFPLCDTLQGVLLYVSGEAVRCTDQQELIRYLPDVITNFNIDEINLITAQLGTAARAYEAELEARQVAARLANRNVYRQGIEAFQNSPEMVGTLERIRDNASRCLMGSCDGTRFEGQTTKPADASLAWCARYVTLAMFPAGESGEIYGDFSEYPWGSDAVESGSWLRREGFMNLMDVPEMAHLTPDTAPVGSIIVYEKDPSNEMYNVDGVRRGGPGHVEIKLSANEYASDFINDEPTTLGGARKPIGIYVNIPPDILNNLEEIPQR